MRLAIIPEAVPGRVICGTPNPVTAPSAVAGPFSPMGASAGPASVFHCVSLPSSSIVITSAIADAPASAATPPARLH